MLGIVEMAGTGAQTSGATCHVVLHARPFVYIRGMVLWTLELRRFMAQSCSDLQIPAGPAWTNRTAGAEEAFGSAWSPSPVSSAPSPSPASRTPFSAAWSECEGKVQEIIGVHQLSYRSTSLLAVRRSYLQVQSAWCRDLWFPLEKTTVFDKWLVNYNPIIMTKKNELFINI